MKRLSDYKDEDAIELWADLLEPVAKILADRQIIMMYRGGKTKAELAKYILKTHKTEAVEILVRIDSTPINALNVAARLMALLADVGNNKELMSFFDSAGQEMMDKGSSGSATENTGAEEH